MMIVMMMVMMHNGGNDNDHGGDNNDNIDGGDNDDDINSEISVTTFNVHHIQVNMKCDIHHTKHEFRHPWCAGWHL
jgi:hypothetical protein